jgi:DNA repair photolyase
LPFHIFETDARTILSPVSGFLAAAGFTHSLTPARNCVLGCSYCYVPTMRVQAGLRPEDWKHWGERTTFKRNAAALLSRALRHSQIVYCSPLTDPYQSAEEQMSLMPGLLDAVASRPPRAFVIQTRGPLILRDIGRLRAVAARTRLRVGFSVTSDREDVRRVFEPRCALLEERWRTIAALRAAGIPVAVTIAPILPCDPEALAARAMEMTAGDAAAGGAPVIADPLHTRAVKRGGATTREAAVAICARYGWEEWLDPAFQSAVVARLKTVVSAAGREFGCGAAGFALLARDDWNSPGT